jgi:hypothetical protein
VPGRLALAATAAVLAAVAALPSAALAHGESSPLIRGVVDRVQPRVPGVNLVPVSGTASLLNVVNTTSDDLVLLSPEGEPFLRVGPRGAYGNRASPYWWRSGNPDGVPGRRAPLRPGARERWTLVSREPAWAYYEHRLHPGTVRLPRSARDSREPVRLAGFAIRLRHGGRPMTLDGHLEFRPVLGRVRTAMTSAPQPLPGVTLSVLEGRFPGVLLRNASGRTVVVEGRAGEPFARVGPRGAEVNVRSPTYVDDRRARGLVVRTAADAGAAPRWRRTGRAGALTWLESRARYAPEQPPDDVTRRRQASTLVRWRIPLRAQGERAVVAGTTSWLPGGPSGLPGRQRSGAPGTPAWPAIPAALALAAGAGLLVRTRRRRAARPPLPSPR